MYVITFVHDGNPFSFVFDRENEAYLFSDHLDQYYKIDAPVVRQSIDTYDSAIEFVVEAIGPSEDEDTTDIDL